MKKTIALLLALLCIAVFMVGCSNTPAATPTPTPEAVVDPSPTPEAETTPDPTPTPEAEPTDAEESTTPAE